MNSLAAWALLVALCGGCHAAAINATASTTGHGRPEICLNHTDVTVPFLRNRNIINATAAVIEANKTCGAEYTWSGTECTKSIVTTAHCAAGYLWRDGQCERIEDVVCPAGYHKSELSDQCELRLEFSVSCPPEHQWNGENCVHSVPSCRQGYQLVNGTCVKLVAGSCPVGTELELGKCVRTQSRRGECSRGFELVGAECRRRVESICDADFQLIDGQCVRRQTAEPVYKCPPDMRLEGLKCVSRVQTCPVGYELNGTQCVNVTLRCPENSTLNANGSCVRSECLPVTPECDDGMVLQNGQCWQVRPEEPRRCNSSEVLVNGTCVLRCRTAVPSCPAGWRLESGWCVRVVMVPSVQRQRASCLPGYVLDIDWCVYVHPQCVVVLPECPPGFELRDERCVPQVVAVICPNGLVLRGDRCVATEIVCPPGSVLKQNVCEQEAECLDGYVLVNGSCREVGPNICPIGWQFVGGECKPNVTCPLEHHLNGTVCMPNYVRPICQGNYVLEGTWCVPRTPVRPQLCPVGFQLVNGTCYQVGVPPKCPPGYELHSGRCYCPGSQPPTTPAGNGTTEAPPTPATQRPPATERPTTPSGCPVDHPILLPNGTCISVHSVPPTCPPGYVFSAVERLCKRIVAPVNCPWGFDYDAVLERCIARCPSGYVLGADGRCKNAVPPTTPTTTCPPGFYYSAGVCYPNERPPSQPNKHENCTRPCAEGAGGHGGSAVHTVTVVDRPLNVVTNNLNNVNVHVYENGRKVRIHRNNETEIVDSGSNTGGEDAGAEVEEVEVDVDGEGGEVDGDEESGKCCVVVSPRKCERKEDRWECAHRETNRCGWFCTSPKIYLIPRRNAYRGDVLVMRPPPTGWYPRRGGWNAGASDCSGCVSGGYACSSYCYQYESCGYHDECRYVDQQSFCETNAGAGCAEEDGCFE